ncbi:NAD-dependent deacetylase [Albimonas donghaensis]|uniref:NAD-dependent protein deacylase n=1 Tax=Albimonas donghaensis TaxID=356660 RepID=A0A1H2YYM3_9RHOB|nr:NAD-dependent deacylase [Albimonas donghaensis]SDX10155.1 NAD-dependent deacetylase [Albimonas donghaensis]
MTGPEIVILTGAGVSAESGLGTFRDLGGLWTKVRLEDVATPEAFARDPDMVLDFYNARRANARAAEANAAHHALARLQAARPGEVLIVTQNVDDLHERAGALAGADPADLIHIHGEFAKALCAGCDHRWPSGDAPMTTASTCPACGAARVRPDVVWFGEMPYRMEEIYAALGQCALFVSIGTSGAVYPAAGFVAEARAAGADTLELNLEPSEGASYFRESRHGKATEIVPAWVEALLAGG